MTLLSDDFGNLRLPIQVMTLFALAEGLRLFDTANDLLVYYEICAEYLRRYPLLPCQEQAAFGDILGYWD